MKVLVTGGTGFIGSHTTVELLARKHDVVILDNLANSDATVVDGVTFIAGCPPAYIEGDVRDGCCCCSELTFIVFCSNFVLVRNSGED